VEEVVMKQQLLFALLLSAGFLLAQDGNPRSTTKNKFQLSPLACSAEKQHATFLTGL
jgi:hypothetical protein